MDFCICNFPGSKKKEFQTLYAESMWYWYDVDAIYTSFVKLSVNRKKK